MNSLHHVEDSFWLITSPGKFVCQKLDTTLCMLPSLGDNSNDTARYKSQSGFIFVSGHESCSPPPPSRGWYAVRVNMSRGEAFWRKRPSPNCKRSSVGRMNESARSTVLTLISTFSSIGKTGFPGPCKDALGIIFQDNWSRTSCSSQGACMVFLCSEEKKPFDIL